jgi:hypothetical protein
MTVRSAAGAAWGARLALLISVTAPAFSYLRCAGSVLAAGYELPPQQR